MQVAQEHVGELRPRNVRLVQPGVTSHACGRSSGGAGMSVMRVKETRWPGLNVLKPSMLMNEKWLQPR
jgi:hypothetical protein